MMRTVAHNKRMIRLRDFSTAFSRSAFTDVLLFDDFSRFDWLRAQYRLIKASLGFSSSFSS